ncbi:hypothetical protein [Microbulbifer sp. TYP-18]|uniref:hypothetical protein n=1 Tax=Microbulbifer sp. TYP-18 TaxID=3230024 RepID=UPI0034C5B4F2
MREQGKYLKWVNTFALLLIFVPFILVIVRNNERVSRLKSEIINTAPPEQVELCPYSGYYISPNCVELTAGKGKFYYNLLKEAKPSTIPSKAQKSFNKILKFKNFINGDEFVSCINIFQYKDIEHVYYFSPIVTNSECTKINNRLGGHLRSECSEPNCH